MDNFQAKLNLMRYRNAFTMTIKGKTASKHCICIPIEDNHFFVSADDNFKAKAIYSDINVNQYEEGKSQYGDTHYLRMSLPKEVRERMTEDEKKAIPYLGNMRPSQIPVKQSDNIESPTYSVPEDCYNDLPF